ncbi:glycosyltransferase family 2 protein [Priestia megaterium]|jgi:polyisoprenyl-phosphate glycosyltransferase|uniref:glycosyltransferase family 2 protein n=1 Tax=Priestia megaterium TaxID=1404 RepID=UPI001C21947C|nr:glycosyltransferase family 2 protein [Priestia megaterium]MBU8757432.1 glycosyltransferase family 2 protein [Priestia megaterium]
MKLVSTVIPCYNESSSLKKTYKEVKKVLEELHQSKKYAYEILFVNDGSKDDTLEHIKSLAKQDSSVKYISFSRNFGKESGMLAGLEKAKGEVVIILDADLQHPPYLMKEMIEQYEIGYDQVIARRDRKGENLIRKWLTRCYYKMVNNVMDVELADGIGDFRLLSRRAVESILSMPEYNRFSKGIFSWIGYKKKVIDYENNERIAGESKWSFKNLLNYAVDGIISFNNSPLRLLIYLGLLVTFVCICYVGFSFLNILLFGVDMPGYFTLISAILMLGGIQLISIGVIGEYVGRIYYEVKKRPKYILEETNTEISLEKEKVNDKTGS